MEILKPIEIWRNSANMKSALTAYFIWNTIKVKCTLLTESPVTFLATALGRGQAVGSGSS